MTGARSRPGSRISIALTLAIGIAASACQTAMSVEEAKKVAATFGSASFVPPPRTISDITAVLDQQKRTEPESAARLQADEVPPSTTDRDVLSRFYYRRGMAARQIGRAQQEIDDLTKAVTFAPSLSEYAPSPTEYHLPGAFPPIYIILYDLGTAELRGGSISRYVEYRRQALQAIPPNDPGWLLTINLELASILAHLGRLKEAEASFAEASIVFYQSFRWSNQRPEWISARETQMSGAKGHLLQVTGRHAEAEASFRRAIAVLAAEPHYERHPWRDELHLFLAVTLADQGRLVEAENEARKALLGALAKRGRYSPHTAWMLRGLVRVLLEQGRYRESEQLARAVVDIYEKTRVAPDSSMLAGARALLALALGFQRRYEEALREYEASRAPLRGDPMVLERIGGVGYAMVLLRTGHVDRALEVLSVTLERSRGVRGERHRDTAQIRGYLAEAYAARGDAAAALREFREATALLLTRSADGDDGTTTPRAMDQHLAAIVSSHIDFLAAIRGTTLEREAGIDATEEAFRLANAARGRSVQRALNASAVRAVAKSPVLADLVRRKHDSQWQLNALHSLLGSLLSQPRDERDPKVVANLTSQIEVLKRALAVMAAQIEKEFPAYADLINPKPITVDEARAMLRPGEALITTLATRERTFVWAVPHAGPVAFTSAPIGVQELETSIATLRMALEPRARTLGDIPDIDLTLAHRLYRALLEPVRSGWQDAPHLFVVADGPLGQLPLALLPTRSVALPADSGPIFSNYRQVPWLVRSHAVTRLPSVASLATLRALPLGAANRRPLIGFGDPYFSKEQAALAAQEQVARVAPDAGRPKEVAALTTRGISITLRSSPPVFDSSHLAMLPRLPDTAEEIQSLARAMNADPTRDVFLGHRANEERVKALDLTNYRVIAFATHGLVPGDLDGLTQPALALSAPDVAGVEGDGLLTMDEILALRLNADWVVLSACNTASGEGAGSDAISGLGRAFFYAGARALLVSNWPVETTSARALTTDLFRRQQGSPGATRAQSLQQTMNWLIDEGTFVDAESGKTVFSYAHPIFWAPFTLIGDGGEDGSGR